MKELSNNIDHLHSYLHDRGWLNKNESIQSVESPGEGNMNFTIRVLTGARTFILKQSRGYVEKYPKVKAPAERVLREAEFYELISNEEKLRSKTPKLLALDRENHVMMLQDLGSGSDYSYIYNNGKSIPEEDLMQIIDFAADLHNGFTASTAPKVIRNRRMRALNHEHIFVFPYLSANDTGLNLDDILPGLKELSQEFKKDKSLKSKVKAIGELYLKDGATLLHGDYFPGSWLNTKESIYFIDPEFCFFGPAEFDIGLCIAHLKMADQDAALIDKSLIRYQSNADIDNTLRQQFTATEILRRILGLAQLPLETNLDKRYQLLNEAREILMDS